MEKVLQILFDQSLPYYWSAMHEVQLGKEIMVNTAEDFSCQNNLRSLHAAIQNDVKCSMP